MALTAPHEASVVTVAKRAESPMPNRTSLPSMLPPVPPAVGADARPAAWWIGFPRCSATLQTTTPARKRSAIAAKTAQPCRTDPVIRPSVFVRPAPIAKIRTIWRKFVPGVGFSYGCAEFALKNPPPLVPSSLIASCEATGPWGIFCSAPSTVFTATSAWKFCTTPRETKKSAARKENGRSTQRIARVQSNQKFPIPLAFSRAIPRITAMAIAMPVAAERKL